MLRNLKAEMARIDISTKDIAEAIDKDEKTVLNKIKCDTEFNRREMLIIKKKFFPAMPLDYLFEQF